VAAFGSAVQQELNWPYNPLASADIGGMLPPAGVETSQMENAIE
jgi:hypothetical protein